MAGSASAAAAAAAAGRGALIVFEGVDRSGKTTQASMLVDLLKAQGTPAEFWRFPDRETTMGKMINSYLKQDAELDDRVVHLLFSANRWEKKKMMEEKLKQGITLIVDRYSYSGVAFSAAKKLPGLTVEWCASPEVGLPKPDAVLFMTLTPEQAEARGGFGEERYETTERQATVRELFSALHDPAYWRTIDAGRSVDKVAADVTLTAWNTISAARNKPLEELWSNPADLPETPPSMR